MRTSSSRERKSSHAAASSSRPSAVAAAFAELRHAAAVVRAAHAASTIDAFQACFSDAYCAWTDARARTDAYVQEHHAAQLDKLQSRLVRDEQDAARDCPVAAALRREQQALLAKQQFTQAFEQSKLVKAAEAKAVAKHRKCAEDGNEAALCRLLEEQTCERAAVELFVSDVERELQYSHTRRLFELGAAPAHIWQPVPPAALAAEADVDSFPQSRAWADAHAYSHEGWPAEEHLHQQAFLDDGSMSREPQGNGAFDAWADANAPARGDYVAAAAAAFDPWAAQDSHWHSLHGQPGGPAALRSIVLVPIPPGWSGRQAPPAAAPAKAEEAAAPDVEAVAKLLSAAARLVGPERHAAHAARAPQTQDALPQALSRGDCPLFPATAAAVAHADAAAAWTPSHALHPSPLAAVPAAAKLQAVDHSASADWWAPAPRAYELSDDSSDASDGAPMEALRDAPAVGVDGSESVQAAGPPQGVYHNTAVGGQAKPSAAPPATARVQAAPEMRWEAPPAPAVAPTGSLPALADAVAPASSAELRKYVLGPASAALPPAAPAAAVPSAAPLLLTGGQVDAPPAQQSGFSALLAARRAAETSARAAAAQRREFTTADFRQLFSFCRHGKYRQAKDLLRAGCPVDGRDQFGNTPLMIACQNGHARLVKVLLRHGAVIDAANQSGNTGLHYAVTFGFTPLADFLISQGANDAIRNSAGLTPYEGIK